MEFNSQICTTREQSERLLALGLKKETADMSWIFAYHWECFVGNPEELYTPDEDGDDDVYIPAWSLHRLMEIISQCFFFCEQVNKLSVRGHFVKYIQNKDESCGFNYPLYDKLIEYIEWMFNKGLINPKYLEEQK